jgi:methionyl aminopeptidase
MRDAGRLVEKILADVRQLIQPGVTTREIDAFIEQFFRSCDAAALLKGFPGPTPFPAVSCVSLNEEATHGIPGSRRLIAGDLVTIDTACRLDGWCTDAACTYPVLGLDPQRQRLLEAGQRVLETAIREFGRQPRWSDVVRAIEREVALAGVSLVTCIPGHGIGRELHEDPLAYFTLGPGEPPHDFPLQPGLVLAIEPIVTWGVGQVRLQPNGWTMETTDGMPCVHFEHTIALTEDGPLVLT